MLSFFVHINICICIQSLDSSQSNVYIYTEKQNTLHNTSYTYRYTSYIRIDLFIYACKLFMVYEKKCSAYKLF